MIESAKPPAHALWWWPISSSGSFVLTTSAKTKMPITIDGKPFRTSSQSLIWSPTRRGSKLADEDRDQHPDRDRDRRRDQHEHDRPDECGRDTAARLVRTRPGP